MKRLRPVPASREILEKIEEKHGLDFAEVEELFLRPHTVLRGRLDVYGERRYASLGTSSAGRYLMVVYAIPERGIAKVITARDMTAQERRYYGRTLRSRRMR